MFLKLISSNSIPVTWDTIKWSSALDIVSPIDTNMIPEFKNWVNWNGFDFHKHPAYDFATYIDNHNNVILGLPQIEVYAVADGKIIQIHTAYRHRRGNYLTSITIEHGKGNMHSYYLHLIPCVEQGKTVNKGEKIGLLHMDTEGFGFEGRLVHLHFELLNSWFYNGQRKVDPVEIFPKLNSYIAHPQGEQRFSVNNLETTNIVTANFQRLLLNNG